MHYIQIKVVMRASNGGIHVIDQVAMFGDVHGGGPLDGLGGTGSIKDVGRRWPMPITGGIAVRF